MSRPPAARKPFTSETIDLLQQRSSVRDFTSDPVPRQLIEVLIAAAVRAPTSFNFQAYAMIVLSGPARLADLAAITGQQHVAKASAAVVMCADLARLQGLGRELDEPVEGGHDDARLTAIVDASVAGACFALAAESAGLGTVMLGAVRNQPAATAKLLRLPPGVTALFGVCLGWPAQQPRPRPRLRPELVTHEETYQAERATAALAATEATLSHPDGAVSAADIVKWRQQHVRGLRMARERAEPTEGVGYVPDLRMARP